MGRPILVLRLEGPLQAWGTRARWDVRDTGLEPTKSGIVGLLGCALGYGKGDPRLETELDAGLRMGVRTEHPGTLMEDFHTVTGFLPTAAGEYKVQGGTKSPAALTKLRQQGAVEPATIISPRQYLEDAAFLVALEARDECVDLLACCAEAVQAPRWPLYLGRKACVPTRPIFVEVTETYADVPDLLMRYPWAWTGASTALLRALPPTVALCWEATDGPHVRQDAMRVNVARQYAFRRLHCRHIPRASVMQEVPA